MLILTRKPGEKLYIGDKIIVTIVEIKGHQIRVGIDAPADLRIYREEIYLQIMEENRQAAAASSDAGLEGLGQMPGWKGGTSPLASGKAVKLGTASALKSPMPTAKTSQNPEVIVRRKKNKSDHE